MRTFYRLLILIVSTFSISLLANESYLSTKPVELEFHVHSPSLLIRLKAQNNNLPKIIKSIHTKFKRKVNLKIQSDNKEISINEGYFYFPDRRIIVSNNGVISIKTDKNEVIPLGKLNAAKVKCIDNANCIIGVNVNAEVGFNLKNTVSRPYRYYVVQTKQTFTTTAQINYKGNLIEFFATANGTQNFQKDYYSSKSMTISTPHF